MKVLLNRGSLKFFRRNREQKLDHQLEQQPCEPCAWCTTSNIPAGGPSPASPHWQRSPSLPGQHSQNEPSFGFVFAPQLEVGSTYSFGCDGFVVTVRIVCPHHWETFHGLLHPYWSCSWEQMKENRGSAGSVLTRRESSRTRGERENYQRRAVKIERLGHRTNSESEAKSTQMKFLGRNSHFLSLTSSLCLTRTNLRHRVEAAFTLVGAGQLSVHVIIFALQLFDLLVLSKDHVGGEDLAAEQQTGQSRQARHLQRATVWAPERRKYSDVCICRTEKAEEIKWQRNLLNILWITLPSYDSSTSSSFIFLPVGF